MSRVIEERYTITGEKKVGMMMRKMSSAIVMTLCCICMRCVFDTVYFLDLPSILLMKLMALVQLLLLLVLLSLGQRKISIPDRKQPYIASCTETSTAGDQLEARIGQ